MTMPVLLNHLAAQTYEVGQQLPAHACAGKMQAIARFRCNNLATVKRRGNSWGRLYGGFGDPSETNEARNSRCQRRGW